MLWPQASAAAPFAGDFEWPAALIGLAAAIALFRYKLGIMPAIGACAAAGLAWSLVAAG